MIQTSLTLNENQWTYNIVDALRDDGFFDKWSRKHANQWFWIHRKLDPIFPGFRTTHRYVYVRLQCGFLGAESADGPQPCMFVSAVAQPRPITVPSQSQSIMKVKLNWVGEDDR